LTKNLGENRGAQAIQNLLEEGVTFLRDLIAWVGPTDDEETVEEPVAEPEPAAEPGPGPGN
jgi:hypothetical protein